ncbi:MAG TPA: hypothetical protein VF899_17010, partial [Pyrinomonadaceae bacterium]
APPAGKSNWKILMIMRSSCLSRPRIEVEPTMVGEVAFTERPSDGSIRHPSFQGLCEDKNPKEVVREEPLARAES